MHDRVHAVERTRARGVIADVALDPLRVVAQVLGPGAPGVDLRIEVVEHADGVPFGEEPVREMGADEPGSARDEYAHRRTSFEEKAGEVRRRRHATSSPQALSHEAARASADIDALSAEE